MKTDDFVPVYCVRPACQACHRTPVPYYARKGKIRYHKCPSCGHEFKSFEFSQDEFRRHLEHTD